MKFLRYMLIVVLAFVVIVLLINMPKLGIGMWETITNITMKDWAKYIVGAIIGSTAMWFAKRERLPKGK